jgi:hypothetical protein
MGLDSTAQADLEMRLPTARQQTIAFMQTRLAQSMREIFFRQIRLINAMTVELPLGWISGGAKSATDSHGSSDEPRAEANGFLASPSLNATPSMTVSERLNQDLTPSPQSEAAPVAQSKALRKNKGNRRKSLS